MGRQLLGYGVALSVLVGLLIAIPGVLLSIPFWVLAFHLSSNLEDY